MKTWQLMTLHSVAAAAFIFLLQRYALSASLESASLWALTFGVCAAGLAYARKAPGDVKESRDSFIEKRPGVYTGT